MGSEGEVWEVASTWLGTNLHRHSAAILPILSANLILYFL